VATDKTLDEGVARRSSWSRTVNFINPLKAVWWLFTNVRFAIVLLVLLVVVSLLGVLIPQVPSNFRGDEVSTRMWIETTQKDDFGFMTDPMKTVGLFDVFHQQWFALLLATTVASTGAYVVSRFPGVWQTVTRPRKRVPDRYLEMAPHRYKTEGAIDIEQLDGALRAKRYRVERTVEGEATYLFADRFQWAQFGTLLTHAAVIVFILSAVVSRIDSFSSPLFLSEGGTLPVFPVKDPNQMQVQLVDSYAQFAPDGQPLDYRADLVIYKRGDEVLRCSSTVNTPCQYDGYRFYQAAYFGYGAEVEVLDLATGNVIYHETLALTERVPSPRLVISQGGETVVDDTVLLTDSVDTGDTAYRAALLNMPDGTPLTLWQPVDGGDLLVFEPGGDVRTALAEGGTFESGDLSIAYTGTDNVPASVIDDFPMPESAGKGTTGAALLELTNTVYGTGETSEGDHNEAPISSGEPPELTIAGLQTTPVTLAPGEEHEVDGLRYTFVGQAEFAGIDVRRDRSDMLVWIGAAFTVVGLMITFWVPRRRLWAKLSPRQPGTNEPGLRLAMAGQAPGHADFTRELWQLARQAGADTERTEDDE
jgi:cytochrome c biogenesis protein ResB